MEVAFDSSGRGFYRLFAERLDTPSNAMVARCLRDGSEGGVGVLGYLELDQHPVVVSQVFHMLFFPSCSPPGETVKG